jgi:hypothetical protein
MKVMWCWRCKQDMPMLDEEEYHAIYALFGECFHRARERPITPNGERLTLHELFEPVRKEYERMTEMIDCHHNAILHHRISTYGPPCSRCGKPLRTTRARFCAACGQVVSS